MNLHISCILVILLAFKGVRTAPTKDEGNDFADYLEAIQSGSYHGQFAGNKNQLEDILDAADLADDIDAADVLNKSPDNVKRRMPPLTTFERIAKINKVDPKHFYQVDIRINKHSLSRKRNAVNDREILWKSNLVPYTIDAMLAEHTSVIKAAIDDFEKSSCLRFVERADADHGIHFVKEQGCWSFIGRQNDHLATAPYQKISIGEGCQYKYIIIHEIMHAIGFFHEQSRYDRDNFVRIVWENIQEGMEGNFNKENKETMDTLNLPYDYDGIMHYGAYAFTTNGMATIIPVGDPNRQLGNTQGLSKTDIAQVNALYQCSVTTQSPITTESTTVVTTKKSSTSTSAKTSTTPSPAETTETPTPPVITTEEKTSTPAAQTTKTPSPPVITTEEKTSTPAAQTTKTPTPPVITTEEKTSTPAAKTTNTPTSPVVTTEEKTSTPAAKTTNTPTPPVVTTEERTSTPAEETTKTPSTTDTTTTSPITTTAPPFLDGLLSCTFEDGLCLWRRNVHEQLQWKRYRMKRKLRIGPSGDHTTGDGHFLVALKYNRRHRRMMWASIVSPAFQIGNKDVCLQFYYNMRGNKDGILMVFSEDLNTGDFTNIHEIYGQTDEGWTRAAITLNSALVGQRSRIDISFLTGKKGLSLAAIDDITATEGKCPPPKPLPSTDKLACPIDKDFCAWKQLSSDSEDWRIVNGSLPYGASSETFGYIPKVGRYYRGKYAVLQSPKVQTSNSSCLTISAQLKGRKIGRLQLYLIHALHGQRVKVGEYRGRQTDAWFKINVDLPVDDPFYVQIRGQNWRSRNVIKIDNIVVKDGHCLY